jgi:hypothetical protein
MAKQPHSKEEPAMTDEQIDTENDIETCIHEILQTAEEPASITAEVSELLTGVTCENVFEIRRIANRFAKTIADEHAMQEADMVEIVRKLNAVLEPMIAWLKKPPKPYHFENP